MKLFFFIEWAIEQAKKFISAIRFTAVIKVLNQLTITGEVICFYGCEAGLWVLLLVVKWLHDFMKYSSDDWQSVVLRGLHLTGSLRNIGPRWPTAIHRDVCVFQCVKFPLLFLLTWKLFLRGFWLPISWKCISNITAHPGLVYMPHESPHVRDNFFITFYTMFYRPWCCKICYCCTVVVVIPTLSLF